MPAQLPTCFARQSGRGVGGKHDEGSCPGFVQQLQPAQAGGPVPDENEVQARQIERQREHILQFRNAKYPVPLRYFTYLYVSIRLNNIFLPYNMLADAQERAAKRLVRRKAG